jgi:predicted esterase
MNRKHIIFVAYLLCTFSLHTVARLPKVLTIFSHGIADTMKQVYGYAKSYSKNNVTYRNDRYLIHTPFVSFNYPDATTKFYRVNYAETSFGQKNEIDRLLKTYQKAITQYGSHYTTIILWGLSRGASNVLIFAGLHNLPNIKALLLESPYFTMGEVIESVMKKKRLDWLPVSYGETIAELIFKKYSRHGYSPANCAEHITKDMPILIICSKEDNLVPYASSINVYKKLVATGHKHTYIFITEHGRHAAILQGTDGENYQYVVNAFYKKYNLPYCAVSAAKGESLLALCQPTFD